MNNRILMIDNYDSFTFNLVQYLGELGAQVTVRRNDAIDIAGVRALAPDAIVISPGPCTPRQAGISVALIRELAGELPLLGRLPGPSMYRRGVRRTHRARQPPDAWEDLADHARLADDLRGSARRPSKRSAIIRCWWSPTRSPNAWRCRPGPRRARSWALRHKRLAVEGVQFHPESILTQYGKELLKNFLAGAMRPGAIHQ